MPNANVPPKYLPMQTQTCRASVGSQKHRKDSVELFKVASRVRESTVFLEE